MNMNLMLGCVDMTGTDIFYPEDIVLLIFLQYYQKTLGLGVHIYFHVWVLNSSSHAAASVVLQFILK